MKILKGVIWSLIGAYLVSGILLLIIAFLMYKTGLSDGTLAIGMGLIYIISNVVGGLIIGRYVDKRKFIWGLIIGLVYIVILYLIGCVLGGDCKIGEIILPMVLSVVGSVFGAVMK